MSTFGGLDAEPYISLETFKKSGDGVKTPVWFARVGDALWVVTDGTSYKVKRLRRDPRVRLAQCDMRGAAILGAWRCARSTGCSSSCSIWGASSAAATSVGRC